MGLVLYLIYFLKIAIFFGQKKNIGLLYTTSSGANNYSTQDIGWTNFCFYPIF
jgi:hypothetical protein